MDATTRPSQQLLNAQKELARRRQMAGVSTPVTGGQGSVISEQYSVTSEQFSVISEQWSVDSEQWSVDSEQYSVTSEQFSVISEQWSVDSEQPTINEHLSAIHNGQSVHPTSEIPHPKSHVRISPTLAAHCLDRQNRTNDATLDAPYRLYKILGALDENGRGWLANSDIEPRLTHKESPFYLYGRRQLKIILRRGEGLFWQRVKSKGQLRIRLVSRAKLLEALSPGSRLRGREVEIPLAYLLGHGSQRSRQADANAALYAAVHAGRLRPDSSPAGVAKPRPISRARLQELAGCSAYRQRSYERRMNITVEPNIHILGEHNEYELERARRHFDLPVYKHTDYQGKINRHRRGAAYIAMRLPNSYHLPDTITVVNSRRQRTINRALDGLCHMGSGGSDREAIVRRYHRDAATAVRANQHDNSTPAYWPITRNGATRLWQTVAGGQKSRVAKWQGGREEIAWRDRDRGIIPQSEFRTPHSVHPISAIPNPTSKGGDLN